MATWWVKVWGKSGLAQRHPPVGVVSLSQFGLFYSVGYTLSRASSSREGNILYANNNQAIIAVIILANADLTRIGQHTFNQLAHSIPLVCANL
jgi:hypothetical protein